MLTGDDKTLVIEMVEGDWGEILPLEIISDEEFTTADSFVIEIFKDITSIEPIITKKYSNIQGKSIDFSITEEESNRLKIGTYFYNIDWYKENSLLSNIVCSKMFKVINKAGKKI